MRWSRTWSPAEMPESRTCGETWIVAWSPLPAPLSTMISIRPQSLSEPTSAAVQAAWTLSTVAVGKVTPGAANGASSAIRSTSALSGHSSRRPTSAAIPATANETSRVSRGPRGTTRSPPPPPGLARCDPCECPAPMETSLPTGNPRARGGDDHHNGRVPTTNQWLAFVLASALFIQVPGPSLLFTIGRALTVGRRDALLSVVGNALGLTAQVLLVAVGLAAVVGAPVARTSALRSLRIGFTVGLTNPKTIVFFVAFLPQFVNESAGHTGLQLAVLGLVFGVMAACSDSAWALAASKARDWFARRPTRLDKLGVAGGVMMIGLGATMAATE